MSGRPARAATSYRVSARTVRVVRVLHQRRAYFQRVLREEMARYAVKPTGRRRK